MTRHQYPLRRPARPRFRPQDFARAELYGGHARIFDRQDTNIGFINYDTSYTTDISRELPNGTIYLRYFNISPEHRGEGYGSEAYRDFERQMIRHRVREIILVPKQHNPRIKEFWRREGFKKKEILPDGNELWSKNLRH